MVHGLGVELGERVGRAAKRRVHGPIHLVQARRHGLPLLRHRSVCYCDSIRRSKKTPFFLLPFTLRYWRPFGIIREKANVEEGWLLYFYTSHSRGRKEGTHATYRGNTTHVIIASIRNCIGYSLVNFIFFDKLYLPPNLMSLLNYLFSYLIYLFVRIFLLNYYINTSHTMHVTF